MNLTQPQPGVIPMDMPRGDQARLSDDGLAAYHIAKTECIKLRAELIAMAEERDLARRVQTILRTELGAVLTTVTEYVRLNESLNDDPTSDALMHEYIEAHNEMCEVLASAAKCLR